MAPRSLRISSRFALVLVVLVPCLAALMAIGFVGLRSVRNSADTLYSDHLLANSRVANLQKSLHAAEQTSLRVLLADGPALRRQLSTHLAVTVSPAVQTSLSAVVALASDDPPERRSAQAVATAMGELPAPRGQWRAAREHASDAGGSRHAGQRVLRHRDLGDRLHRGHRTGPGRPGTPCRPAHVPDQSGIDAAGRPRVPAAVRGGRAVADPQRRTANSGLFGVRRPGPRGSLQRATRARGRRRTRAARPHARRSRRTSADRRRVRPQTTRSHRHPATDRERTRSAGPAQATPRTMRRRQHRHRPQPEQQRRPASGHDGGRPCRSTGGRTRVREAAFLSGGTQGTAAQLRRRPRQPAGVQCVLGLPRSYDLYASRRRR